MVCKQLATTHRKLCESHQQRIGWQFTAAGHKFGRNKQSDDEKVKQFIICFRRNATHNIE